MIDCVIESIREVKRGPPHAMTKVEPAKRCPLRSNRTETLSGSDSLYKGNFPPTNIKSMIHNEKHIVGRAGRSLFDPRMGGAPNAPHGNGGAEIRSGVGTHCPAGMDEAATGDFGLPGRISAPN